MSQPPPPDPAPVKDDDGQEPKPVITFPRIAALITLLIIVLFSYYWGGFAHDLYKATEKQPLKKFDKDDIWIAGILATTLATGVSTALGVEIAKLPPQVETASGSRWKKPFKLLVCAIANIWKALTIKNVVAIGISVYFLVGGYLLVAMKHSPVETPDFITTMVTSVAGIALGVVGVSFASAAKS